MKSKKIYSVFLAFLLTISIVASAPSISSVSLPTTNGAEVTIAGLGFGASKGSVTLDGTGVTVNSWSDTTVKIQVLAGSGINHNLLLTTTASGSVSGILNFAPPTVTSKTGSFSTSGSQVVFNGNNFGTNANKIIVTIEGSLCKNVQIQTSHTAFSCDAPAGLGYLKKVNIEVDGQTGLYNQNGLRYEIYNMPTEWRYAGKATHTKTNMPFLPENVNVANSQTTPAQLGILDVGIATDFGYFNNSKLPASDPYGWGTKTSQAYFIVIARGYTMFKTAGTYSLGVGVCDDFAYTYLGSSTQSPVKSNADGYAAWDVASGDAAFSLASRTFAASEYVPFTFMFGACGVPWNFNGTNLSGNVYLTNSTCTTTYSYAAPTITSASPSSPTYPSANPITVTFTGTNFGGVKSDFDQFAVNTVVTDFAVNTSYTQISASVSGTPGTYRIRVIVAGQAAYYTYTVNSFDVTGTSTPGSTAGGYSVTLTGVNFPVSNIIDVTLGGVKIDRSAITPVSATQITVNPWPSSAGSPAVQVFVNGYPSPTSPTYSYAAPTIAYSSGATKSYAGGTVITMTGTNLGSNNAFAPITLTWKYGSSIITIPSSSIVVSQAQNSFTFTQPLSTPTISGTSSFQANVSLTVNGRTTAEVNVVILTDPTLTAIASGDQGSTNGGTSVTLTGSNIGPGSLAPVSIAWGNPALFITPTSVSSTGCTFNTPVGSGVVSFKVQVAGRQTSALTYSYGVPTITSFTGGSTEGGPAVIIGTNFGTIGTPLTVTFAGSAVTASATVDHTQITFQVPVGNGNNNAVVVTANGRSSASAAYAYPPPAVTTQTVFPPTSSGVATVTGNNFGSVIGDVSATLGGTAVTGLSFSGNPHHTLSFNVPAGFGPSNLIITVKNVVGSAFSIVYAAPTITLTSTVDSSGVVVVSGTNFGNSVGAISVVSSGYTISNLQLITQHTKISFQVSSGTGTNIPYTLRVSGQSVVGNFSYPVPVLTGISLSGSNPTSGGGTFQVTGNNFGSNAGVIQVFVGSTLATDVSLSGNVITAKAPAGQGSKPVTVTVNGQNSAGSVSLLYDLPVITGVTGDKSTAGGALTITGTNFGQIGTGAISVTFGGQPATDVVLVTNDNTLTIKSPAGTGSKPLVVSVSGRSSTDFLFVYDIPTVGDVSGDFKAAGGAITITGTNFGVGSATVTIGGKPATVSAVSQTSITATAPVGTGKDLAVVVTVDSQSSVGGKTFTYTPPSVNSGGVTGDFKTDGGAITIVGANFGALKSDVQVTINGKSATVNGVSDGTITATAPAGTGSVNSLIVTAGTQASFPVNYAYAKPTIDAGGISGDLSTSGKTVVLTGSNFGTDKQLVSVKIAGKDATDVAITLDHRTITFTAPAGTGKQLPIVVRVNDQDSSVGSFSYNGPSLNPITGNPSTDGSSTIIISGNNFGTDKNLIVASVNGKNCPIVAITVSHTELSLTIPEGQGKDQALTFVVDSQSTTSLFNYAVPSISSITGDHSTGGGHLTLVGNNFGTDVRSVSVTIAGNSVTSLTLDSHYQLQFSSPVGIGATNNVIVTVANQQSTATFNFAYDAPAISGYSGDFSTEGGIVSLTGTNFGNDNTKIDVQINGNSASNYANANHNTLTIKTPEGTGRNNVVSITVKGQTGPGAAFAYSPPTFASASQNVTTSGNGVGTIYGTNFGKVSGDVSISGSGLTFSNIQFVSSHKSFSFAVSAGTGANIPITINVNGQTVSGNFSYSPPQLLGVIANSNPTSGGGQMTISGNYFGATSSDVKVYVNGVEATNVVVNSDSEITAKEPAGQGNNLPVSVTVKGQPSTGSVFLSYDLPSILNVVGDLNTAGGGRATLNGNNLGSVASAIVVKVDGKDVSDLKISQNDQQINFLLPAGRGTKTLSLSVSGQSTTYSFSYDLPVIGGVTGDFSTVGSTVYISGSNFGTVTNGVTVSFNGNFSGTVTDVKENLITVNAPAGTGSHLPLVVSVDGLQSATSYFSYLPPSATGLSGDYSTTGEEFTVSGLNFGTVKENVAIKINGKSATVKSVSETSVTAKAPTGSGKTNALVVEVSGQNSSSINFAYAAPNITLSGLSGDFSTSGKLVTLSGNNFGDVQSQISVTVKGKSATNVLLTSEHHTITFNAPEGTGSNAPLIVSVNGQTSNSIGFTYASPAVSSSDTLPSTAGGSTVVLTGSNFGNDDSLVTVTFGGKSADQVHVLSHTSLSVRLPAGTGSNIPLVVKVDGLVSTSFPLSYSPPTFSGLDGNFDTNGGVITVTGTNFGSSSADIAVTLNGNAIQASSISSSSDSSFSFTTPAGTGKNLPLRVTVGGQSFDTRFSYYQPVINTISSLGYTNGSSVTVYGNYFGKSVGVISATLNGVACSGYNIVVDQNQVIFQVPEGSGNSNLLVLNVDGQSATTNYAYSAPHINKVEGGDSTEGGYLNLTGYNFGNSASVITATLNGVACTDISVSTAHFVLSLKAPAGTGVNQVLSLVVNGQTTSTLYSYGQALVTKISGDYSTSGGVIVVEGKNFGNNITALSVTLGGVAVSSLSIQTPNTQLKFTAPQGSGVNVPLVIVVSGVSASTQSFNYNGPSITSVSEPVSTAGGIVTVKGNNFGNVNSVVSVTIKGTSYPVTITVDHNTLTFVAPEGTGSNVPFVLNVNGQSADSKFSYLPPHADRFTGSTSTAGETITVFGTNFGNDASVFTATLNGVACNTYTISASHTAFTLNVPEGSGTNLQLVVTVNGQSSSPIPFNYGAPSITALSDTYSTAGGSVTLNGFNFGSNTTVTTLTVKGSQVTITGQSHTSLTFQLPPGTGTNLPLSLTVNGQKANSTLSYSAPVIYSVGASTEDDGGHVEVSGLNFGRNLAVVSVTIGGKAITNVSVIKNDTALLIIDPVGTGKDVILSLTVDGQVTTYKFTYGTPSILTLDSTFSTEGSLVNVVGKNFGSDINNIKVTLDGVAVSELKLVNPRTALSFKVPEGTGANHPLKIEVSGVPSTFNYSYNAPSITSVSGPVSTEGGLVTVGGNDFGNNFGLVRVVVDGTTYTVSSFTAHHQLTFQLAAGVGIDHVLSVVVDGQQSATSLVSYLSPVVSKVSGESTTPGSQITIEGDNFGTNSTFVSVTVNGKLATISTTSVKQIVFVAPEGTGKNVNAVVTVGGVSNSFQYNYASPVVSRVEGTKSTVGGNATVIGTNFGNDISLVSATLDGVSVQNLTFVTPHSQLTFNLPSGAGSNLPFVFYVNGQPSASFLFSYEAPSVSSSGFTTPTTGGVVLVNGTNFGPNPAQVQFYLNGKDIGTAFSVNLEETQLSVNVPEGTGANLPFEFDVKGQRVSNFFSYQPPRISNTLMSSTSGDSVVVEGSNFGSDVSVIKVTANNRLIDSSNVQLVSSHTSLRVQLPAGSGANLSLKVEVNGQVATTTYSYLPPTISDVPSTPTAGADVKLTGLNLGSVADLNVTLNGVSVQVVSVDPSGEFAIVKIPQGSGKNLPVVVSVGGQTSASFSFSYLAPSVTGYTPSQVGTQGGSVVVSGQNFGDKSSVLSATLDGKSVQVSSFTAHTSFTFQAPEGSGASHTLVVTVNELSTTSLPFSYAAPVLTSVGSTSTGGGDATFVGANFGTNTSLVKVTINNLPVNRVLVSTNHTTLTVSVPAGVGAGLSVSVTVNGQTVTGLFSYSAPVILFTFSPNTTLGGLVSLVGSNFGNLQAFRDKKISVTYDGNAVTNFQLQVENSKITFNSPSGTGVHAVQLNVGGQTTSTTFAFPAPSLLNVVKSSPTSGSTVVLNGANFGPTPSDVQITIGGSSVYASSISPDQTQLSFTSPSGSGANLTLTLSIQGLSVNGLFNYLAPTISSVNNGTAVNNNGGSVTLQGSNFGNVANAVVVTINGNATPAKVLSADHNEIVVAFPGGVGASQSIKVNVSGQAATSAFAYASPVISDVSGTVGTEGGSAYLTATGLGSDLSKVVVTLNGSVLSGLSFLDAEKTQLSFQVPQGTGANLPLKVTVAGQTASSVLSYSAPQVSNTEGSTSTSGGLLSVTGSNFGSDAGQITVTVGGVPATDVQVVKPNTDISFKVPSGTGANQELKITVNGQSVVSSYSYAAPVVSSVNSVPTQGGRITLTGSNFGTDGSVVIASIDGKQLAVKSAADGSLVLQVPEGSGSQLNGQLSVNGQASNSWTFSYAPPSLINAYIDTVTGELVITGSSLGNQIGDVEVSFGNGDKATNVAFVTYHTQISGTAPSSALQGDEIEITVTVAGQSSTITFNVNAPVIASTTVVPTKGGDLKITGVKFGTDNSVVSVQLGGVTLNSALTGGEIISQVPSGVGSSVPFTLKIGSYSVQSTFAYEAPLITSVDSTSTAGGVVKLSGSSFGSFLDQLTVTVGDKSAQVLSFLELDSSVSIKVPQGSGSKELELSVGDQTATTIFEYSAPSVSSVSLAPTIGGTVQVEGSSFGNDISTLKVTVGSTVLSSGDYTIKIAHSVFTFKVPAGTGRGKSFTVEVDGKSTTATYSYEAPHVDSTSLVGTEGGLLTLTGKGFGSDSNLGQVLIDSVDLSLSSVSIVSDSSLTLQVPFGSGKNLTGTLTVDGQSTTFSFAYAAPSIASVTPIPTLGGRVSLSGSNLGRVSNLVKVTVGDKEASQVTVDTNDSEISFYIDPQGAASPFQVVVSVAGQPSAAFSVNYAAPVVTSVSEVPTQGGWAVIAGSNFGVNSNLVEVLLDGFAVETQLKSDGEIRFKVPSGSGSTHSLTVLVSGSRVDSNLAYSSPVISSVSSLPTAGGSVDISGSNFGSDASLISVKFDGNQVPFVLKTAHSVIEFQLPEGSGTSKALEVTVDEQTSTFSLNYAAPVVTYVTSSDVSGGSVTLEGYNFGTSSSSLSVTIGSSTVSNVQLSADGKTITFDVGAGTDENIDSTLTVDGQTAPFKYTFGALLIETVSSAPLEGGPVFVTGSNFGTDLSALDVELDGTPVQGLALTSNGFSFNAPAGSGAQHTLTVTKGTKSVSKPFNYALPLVSSSGRPSTRGESIEVQGSNFGTVPSLVKVFMDGVELQTELVSSTQTRVQIPAGTGIHTATLSVDGQTTTFSVAYLPPVVKSMSATTSAAGTVVISGDQFGSNSSAITVFLIGAEAYATKVSVNSDGTQITCQLPVDSLVQDLVRVSVSGQETTFSFTFSAPEIESSTKVPLSGGSSTISGRHFGTLSSLIRVKIGGKNAPVLDSSESSLTVSVPSGTSETATLSVEVNGLVSAVATFTYLLPQFKPLGSVSPSGGILYIDGSNFGNDQSIVQVTLNGASLPILSLSDTEITVQAPPGNDTAPLFVTFNGLPFGPFNFVYGVPSVRSASKVSTRGGNLTITGANLYGANVVITIGGKPVQVSSVSLDGSQIVTNVPAGVGANVPMVIVIDGVSFNSTFSYDTPIISSVEKSQSNGGPVTVHGDNFGSIQGTVFATLNGVPITVSAFTQDQVVVNIPEGTGANLVLAITVGGQTQTTTFSYQAPEITMITRSPTAGSTVEIYGKNFGSIASVIVVTFAPLTNRRQAANVACTSVTVATANSHVSCTVPSGVGSDRPVIMNVNGQTANGNFSYYPPSVEKASALPTSGGVLTIDGQNFGTDTRFISITANGHPCTPIVVTVPNSQITCVAMPGTGTQKPLIINVGGQLYQGQNVVYQSPSISSAKASKKDGYVLVSFTGTNLGQDGSLFNVTVGGRPCTNVVVVVPDSEFTCQVEGDDIDQGNVEIFVDGQSAGQYIIPAATRETAGAIAQTNPSGDDDSDKKKKIIGGVIGGVVGLLFLLFLILIIVFVVIWLRNPATAWTRPTL
eukprot:TRINITY_DN405_c0_g1_i6.p1 TRINITY_DN405_c0_g1~~TRINITY_DN405_c0_g1_i6.p1  ORF type:complete len:5778 (+),score=1958.70 TRINITY_DN405_c0_g1_i6:207-17540(+)